jgi:hypothetical protein
MLLRRDLNHPEFLRVTLFLPSPPHARNKYNKNSKNMIKTAEILFHGKEIEHFPYPYRKCHPRMISPEAS